MADGTIQVLDLYPNASQSIPSMGAPQNRYLAAPTADPVTIDAAGRMVANHVDGLAAYLVDRVEPGAAEVASGTVTMAGPLHGDLVTLAGVDFTAIANFATGGAQVVAVSAGTTFTLGTTVFTCVEDYAAGTVTLGAVVSGDKVRIKEIDFLAVNPGPANPAAQEFLDVAAAGSDILCAASLTLAINDLATQALFAAVAPLGVSCTGAHGGTSTVTLTADAPGAQGDFALLKSGDPAHITLSGPTMTHTNAIAAAGEFNSTLHLGTDILAAGSLAAAVNASVVPVSAANGGTDTVTITADNRGLVGQLALATSVPAELVLSGAAMAAVAPVAANQEFAALAQAAGGTNAAVATSLRTSIVDAASIAAMQAVTGGPYVDAAVPVGAVITLSAVDNVGAPLPGNTGNLEFDVSNNIRLVQDAVSTQTEVLNRTHQRWTNTTQRATTSALRARVTGGLSLTQAAIDAILLAQCGTDLTGSASASTGTVADILAICAGRGYRVKKLNAAGAYNQYMTVLNPDFEWNATARGGFTEAVTVNGDLWGHGEVKSSGVPQNREISPIRHTVDTDSFQISLQSGTLAVFAAKAGMPPVTLWPDSDYAPHYPWAFQGALQFPQVDNARVLTVYDDNGNVLA
jgi:hypothetical protein